MPPPGDRAAVPRDPFTIPFNRFSPASYLAFYMITINSLSVFIAHVQHEIDHPLGDTCLLEGANSSLHNTSVDVQRYRGLSMSRKKPRLQIVTSDTSRSNVPEVFAN